MTILIIEDETPAYKKLLNYITNYFGNRFEHAHVRSVSDGIVALKSNDVYDLIFADIKILNGTSFDIFNQVTFSIPIIFCTAYDEHLLKAFQTNGIAYILKPYSQEDLNQAITKFETLFEIQPYDRNIFNQFKSLLDNKDSQYKKRLAVKKKEGVKLIDVSTICLIEVFGDQCKLYDNAGMLHVITKSLGALYNELNPNQFFKINRSQVVQINYIENIAPHSKNRLYLKIAHIKNQVVTSSSMTKAFRIWLEH
ncbi:LytR/AlgR family response regulator transcription factor [Winogradskyella flava]|uniref:Response regulator transcription factor n=1 Tax=Winogradskyella flava TaxID=1884876 RepID=A0A842ISF5_9FLAO|nr:LytTR family DNA-binding domain-containing protein [Winogradskyella flava]MBC2845089.1 response regulator transcription factor [Winogradskyella flava]